MASIKLNKDEKVSISLLDNGNVKIIISNKIKKDKKIETPFDKLSESEKERWWIETLKLIDELAETLP